MTLARNLAKATRRQAANGHKPTVRGVMVLDLIDPLLEAARVEVRDDGDRSAVRFSSATDVKPAEVIKAFLPAAQASREAARRAQSVDNMKMVGLAFHNYRRAHGDRFPPAVLYGSDGKTPHSWRVALLPYIGRQELFNQYNFNEPWDGPNNHKLLDKIPSIYRARAPRAIRPTPPTSRRPAPTRSSGPRTGPGSSTS